MSYAQRHRNRLELHQSSLGSAAASVTSTPLMQTPSHKAASIASDHVAHHNQQQQQTYPAPEGGPQRSTSSVLRTNAARAQQGGSTGIDIAAWTEATSNAVAGERQPFQLLQRTPPKSDPPRLKASRKQFASPHLSTAPSEGNQSVPVSLPIVVNSESPERASRHDARPDSLATNLRTEEHASAPVAAGAAAEAVDEDVAPSHEHADEHSDALAAGEMSPSPIPISHQPSQPQQPFAESSPPSSARLSTSQWPASETFTMRLKNIMETRQQIESLVQKQREDEEQMAHALAALDERSQLSQPQQQLPSSPDSAAPRGTAADTVHRRAYDQVLMERNAAFDALREFKEKGNAIVHHLYDTVKSQQEQSLELMATVEALKKANKRLKEAVSNGGSGSGGRAGDNAAGVPGTVAELQQKVLTQRNVIEQMDQLMQSADRMLLAMRARVEVAERRAASSAAPPLDRSQLPPLPKGGARHGPAAEAAAAPVPTAAAVATPDAVGAIERLAERYPADHDLATVAVQQQLLLDRITQLRQSLKQEQAQRLHLEEVYGATSEETARSVALLEERLQRAENPRGVPYTSGNQAAHASALQTELHAQLEEKEDKAEAAPAHNVISEAPQAKAEDDEKAVEEEEEAEESEKPLPGVAPVADDDADQARPPTPSNASSRASSRSSTPTRSLFTAVSIGDAATDGAVQRKAVPRAVVVSESIEATPADERSAHDAPGTPLPIAHDGEEVEAGVEESPSPLPLPKQKDDDGQQRQPRAYLSRHRRAASDKEGEAGAAAAAAAAPKAPLGIPVPDASSLGNSLRRSFNSRSSSASRRLVDFRPAVTADATSRGLESGSEDDEDADEGEDVDVDVDVDGDVVETNGEADAVPESSSHSDEKKSTNDEDDARISTITGVTPTVTPTAIHSASSPLKDTSTSAELSAKRQQRLHKQMEELDKLEADVTNVVRSLDVE